MNEDWYYGKGNEQPNKCTVCAERTYDLVKITLNSGTVHHLCSSCHSKFLSSNASKYLQKTEKVDFIEKYQKYVGQEDFPEILDVLIRQNRIDPESGPTNEQIERLHQLHVNMIELNRLKERFVRVQRELVAGNLEAKNIAEVNELKKEFTRLKKELSDDTNLQVKNKKLKSMDSTNERPKIETTLTKSNSYLDNIFHSKEEKHIIKKSSAMDAINELVGMSEVKSTLDDWMTRAKGIEKIKKHTSIKPISQTNNVILTGNPGVGKTILARLLKDVFFESGFIKENKIIEVKAEDLIAKYVGQTAQKTQDKILEAMGGVFFLDEAYRLSNSFASNRHEGSFGIEALETIMGYMENPNIIFIFAGYEDKIQTFMDSNEGFRSRVKTHFRLKDYTLEELTEIGLNHLSKSNYNIDQIKEAFPLHLKKKMRQGILSGNGRTVIQLANEVAEKHLVRISALDDSLVKEQSPLLAEDVEKAFSKKNANQDGLKSMFDEATAKINNLIGMHVLKKEIEKIAVYQYMQMKRRTFGMKTKSKSHHMLFLGNPGTGKTTLARLIGELFRGAGVLTNGHFIEATKDMLTSGQDIPKQVKSLVMKALGGVLFIDEAYTLANDMKGKEALDALIPLMENHRDDLVVILAGYEDDMKRLFKVNEGLSSRIPYHFTFEDYSIDELMNMTLQLIQTEDYQLVGEVKQALQTVITLSKEEGKTSGNGRWVRNLFEQMVMCQNKRLFEFESKGNEVIEEDLISFYTVDIMDAYDSLANLSSDVEDLTQNLKEEKNISDKITA